MLKNAVTHPDPELRRTSAHVNRVQRRREGRRGGCAPNFETDAAPSEVLGILFQRVEQDEGVLFPCVESRSVRQAWLLRARKAVEGTDLRVRTRSRTRAARGAA